VRLARQRRQIGGMNHGPLQTFDFSRRAIALRDEQLPTRVADQPELAPARSQAQVGVVLAQQQAVFRAAGEHSIRLARAARNQIDDEHADVGLVTPRPARRALLHTQRRIDAGENALRRRRFVAGRAVDLAREEQAGDELRLQAVLQVARIEVVVFDCVAGPRHVRALESGDRPHQRELHVERQAGRDAVRIDLVRGQAFRLDEDLVRSLVREAMHLVLDRRAIARTDAFDHAGEHRRAIATGADDLVRALVGRGDVAADLARMIAAPAEVRKHRHRLIAGLHRESRVVDRATVDARRRAGLETTDAEGQGAQSLGQAVGRRIAGATALIVRQADVDLAAEERADGQHYRPRAELDAGLRDDAANLVAFDQQIGDLLLEQREVRLVLQHRADRLLVQDAIGLRARRSNGGALARIQDTELDAGAIGRLRHRATERVDLLDQMTLADTADRRVAAHLPERLDALRQQQRAHTHARRGQSGLGAGVPAANDDDVEFL